MGGAVTGAFPHLRDTAQAGHNSYAHHRLISIRHTCNMPLSPQQRKANLRLALILASVAAMFVLGFVTKIAWLAS